MEDIYKFVASILKVPKELVNHSTSMNDLVEWDSLTHMTLITEIETKYSLHLDGDQIASMTNLAAIKEIIEQSSLSSN